MSNRKTEYKKQNGSRLSNKDFKESLDGLTLGSMPDDEILYDLSDIFKVFGDSTRLKILFTLSKNEMCVCDIAEAIDRTQSAISHQLKILKQNKLVKFRRDGKTIVYSIADSNISRMIMNGLSHIKQ